MMESLLHEYSAFITLTYSDDFLPEDMSLKKKDLQDFFKRLRHHFPNTIRYYCSGEYGPKTERPHYHGVLFGVSPWMLYGTRRQEEGPLFLAWKKGFTTSSELSPQRAKYVAKYTTKDQRAFLSGTTVRIPEFSVMSRRPGIGLPYLSRVSAAIQAHGNGRGQQSRRPEIPGFIRIGGVPYPLDAHCRERLTELLGLTSDQSIGVDGSALAFDMQSQVYQLLGDPQAKERAADFAKAEKRFRWQEEKSSA